MAYTAVSDVQANIPEFAIGTTSKPSTTEVTNMIAQIEAAVNGVLLSQGYTEIPATGTNDVLMLRGYVVIKVAAMTLLAAYRGDKTSDKVKLWTDDFTAFMSRLRLGQQRLFDQAPTVAQENEVVFTKFRVLPEIPDDA